MCRDEGFFPHTSNCKKYFWCVEVLGTGIIAHTFTCPEGLFFNSLTDGCDFRFYEFLFLQLFSAEFLQPR